MRLLLVLLGALSMSRMAIAQSNPWWEVGGAYQFGRADYGGPQPIANSITMPAGLPSLNAGPVINNNGFDVSLQENSRRWWGGIGDFSGSYGSRNIDISSLARDLGLAPAGTQATAHFHPSLYTLTYGPQFTHRGWGPVEGFARVMVGGAWSYLSPDAFTRKALLTIAPQFNPNDTSFALIAGAGFDYPWKHRLAFRLSEDYVRTFLYGDGQNSFRLSAGVDVRFGRR